ncbi:hypothetical protein [Rhizobium sp. G21]|uniref:hypothetical protein n=1 Tax=Rhizobium sp. G21 TaxID=2758439 RepID=UPI001AEEA636|nr:hypothetical protein [Rhizobium sp. G21]
MTEDIQFAFIGEIVCESFIEFARHRAARLDLALVVGACNDGCATMRVTGQEALVDMFEMACSLGPSDCVIREVTRAGAWNEI